MTFIDIHAKNQASKREFSLFADFWDFLKKPPTDFLNFFCFGLYNTCSLRWFLNHAWHILKMKILLEAYRAQQMLWAAGLTSTSLSAVATSFFVD